MAAQRENCVPGNDWSVLSPPAPDALHPTRSVSIVIPVHNDQPKLDRTLASLSNQTYPSDLVEVVVVDDGSEPPAHLPPLRPTRTRLIRSERDGGPWGSAAAVARGVAASSGEIVLRLDSDMVVYPEHVAAHARWHHVTDIAVVLGYKRFVEVDPDLAPEDIDRLSRSGGLDALGHGRETHRHEWVEELIEDRGQLLEWTWEAWRVTVGSTLSMTRAMYDRAGGMAPSVVLGGDTELGYRLDTAGAVFVPEPAAKAWHQGMTRIMRKGAHVHGFRVADFEARIPHPWAGPRNAPLVWQTPRHRVVLAADGATFEDLRAATSRLLREPAGGVAITAVFSDPHTASYRTGTMDDLLGPGRTRAMYEAWSAGDPRITVRDSPPDTGFPAMFTVWAPWWADLTARDLQRLTRHAAETGAGTLRMTIPAGRSRESGRSGAVVFSLTKALSRADWCQQGSGRALFGVATLDQADLRREPPPAAQPDASLAWRAYKRLPPAIRRRTSRTGRALRERRDRRKA